MNASDVMQCLPGKDTCPVCFFRLLDRNVYSNDNSPFSLETTNGISTAACLCGPLPLVIFGIAICILAMHDCLFDSLHSDSLEKAFEFWLLYLRTSPAKLFALSMIYEQHINSLISFIKLSVGNTAQQVFSIHRNYVY